jgi:predicted metalloprotease with PDZ domain
MSSPVFAPSDLVRYRIQPKNPAAHLFEVTVSVDRPDPAGQRFMLPVWIPGSYMIREFARHIVSLTATANGKPLACQKIDKATWQCAPATGAVELRYEVYAWDLSVRAAHLDETHGFFNGSNVFLLPVGHEQAPCEVEILPPEGERYAAWRLATALSTKASAGTPVSTRLSKASGPEASPVLGSGGVPFGVFTTANYDELIDHPVEMGTFTHASFEACGVTHHIAITGRHRADMSRLCADLKKVCEAQIKLFEPKTAEAPVREYWFLVMAVGDGYGGLEHRASTALLCSRDELPLAGEKKVSNGYRRFLGLASHEYFHTWNVKRIKPAAFIPYNLTQENYTRQLWFFEGFTSYYDDLMLVRSGLIDTLSYLELVAENIGRVTSQSGRTKQSVADSSFDAWVKYYRQDENSPNAIVSYYQKGSMVGLTLDLTIRQKTGGAKSLDDVMRVLWEEFGKTGIGVPEGELEKIASRVAGIDLGDFFAQAVYGTGDLPLVPLFESMAIEMGWKVPGQSKADEAAPATLGVKIAAEANGDARLAQVFDGGAAQAAGLSAGDVVIAVDGLRVTAVSLERRIRSYPVGTTLAFTAFRRDELMTFSVTLQALSAQICSLMTRDTPIDAKARRNAWLMG